MSNNPSRNDTLVNLLVAAGVIMAVMLIAPRLLPTPTPKPAPTTAPTSDAPLPPPGVASDALTQREGTRAATSAPAVQPSEGAAKVGGFTVDEAATEETVTIGAASPEARPPDGPSPYRMRLTLSNIGAAIESATMPDHAATLHGSTQYQLLSAIQREGSSAFRSLAVEKINVDGQDISLSDKRWHLQRDSASEGGPPRREVREGDQVFDVVEFRLDVVADEQPVLRLTRVLRLPQQSRESHRHDFFADFHVENLSKLDQTIVVTYRGGVGIPLEDVRVEDRVVDIGVFTSTEQVEGGRSTVHHIAERQQVDLYTKAAAGPVGAIAWAATENKYFSCTLQPLAPSGKARGENVAKVWGVDLDGAAHTLDDVTVRFVMQSERIPPGQRFSYPLGIYLGEKDRTAFHEVETYRALNYYYQIAQGYGWCTFSWLVEMMILLLNGLHAVVRDYGVAIIILVLIVRTLLHPITKKGQVNMVRMQHRMGAFAPKQEEIRKKFANDKTRMQQELLQLYREEGVNPAGQLFTCLPMVIQIPIWVALYISLNNNIQMRHAPFLFSWIHDLSAPDALYTFASPVVIPLVGWSLPSFNLLPLLVSAFMYLQQKTQPKPAPNPNMTDQQRAQQDMMKTMMPLMSIMMLFIFYHMPSGLNLYIMSSSIFGTIEQYLIRSHIKAHEAAGTLHKPKPTRKDPSRTGSDGASSMSNGRKKKPSLFERLQAMAEEAQKGRHQTRRDKPRR